MIAFLTPTGNQVTEVTDASTDSVVETTSEMSATMTTEDDLIIEDYKEFSNRLYPKAIFCP